MSQRGFTLVEFLVTTALLGSMIGALFALLEPSRDLFVVQPEVQDVQQRLRFAISTLERTFANAGPAMTIGRFTGAPLQALAPVRPYRLGDRNADATAGVFYRSDTVSILRVPVDAVPARIRGVSSSSPLAIVELEPNCRGVEVCGFAIGARIAAVDLAGHAWFGTVRQILGTSIEVESTAIDSRTTAASGGLIVPIEQETYSLGVDRVTGTPRLMSYDGHLSDAPVIDHLVRLGFEYFGERAPPALLDADDPTVPWLQTTYGPAARGANVVDEGDPWPAGENCTFALVEGRHVSRLPTLSSDTPLASMPSAMLTDGPWCPDEASPNRFDADLLRIRRVDVTLRVQASSSWLRGPVSLRFVNGGSGRRESRLVPDQEIHFVVAMRNLVPSGGR
jgi:prepilin-type N-terminal cleavage/methylation domain-containing protein